MSVCLEIHANSCPLLILGGGRQGYRRAKAYLAEGGAVTLSSLELSPELKELAQAHPCTGARPAPGQLLLIEGPFDPALLDHVQLFYAATDDPQCNEAALREARHRGVLAAAVAPSRESTASFMKAGKAGDITLACDTNGGYPALTRPLMDELIAAAGPYANSLPLLQEIRGRVLKLNQPAEATLSVLRALTTFSVGSLEILSLLDDKALQSTLFERKTGIRSQSGQ